jgi:GT2 family glycosyltransferase
MQNIPKIRVVVATRESGDNFFTNTATGKSLALYQFPFLELRLFEKNVLGLSTVYNMAIEESKADPAILVFVHDDVLICDYYWVQQVVTSIQHFHIVGLAGNRNCYPRQASWATKDENHTYDPENLSGIVGHGPSFPPSQLHIYGEPGQEVQVLDGLMLIVTSEILIEKNIRFDERFKFNFYDMDFCRQARSSGLRLGTWPLSVVHQSLGDFKSKDYEDTFKVYLSKWEGKD